jgi:cell division protein FtsQ
MKKILIITSYVLVIGAMIFLMGFIDNKNGELRIQQIEVSIQRQSETILLTKEDVMRIIGNSSNNLIGKPFSEINIEQIELAVTGNQYVSEANVYSTIPGNIYIDIVQRMPQVRVINEELEHFYISTDGHLMSLHPSELVKTLIASGFIRDSLNRAVRCEKINPEEMDSIPDKMILSTIYSLSGLIMGNKFLEAQIEQIYINEDHEIELIPKVGDHIIVIGSCERLEQKLLTLATYYQEGISYNGWDAYKTINLKYKNQIVCTKY